MRCVLVSCLRAFVRCDGVRAPCRCSTATQELRSRRYQFMRCNIGTRARSSSRCRREAPEDRSVGRNPERRVSCKTVLEVNDNSGRQIPGRLTFESERTALKIIRVRFGRTVLPHPPPPFFPLHLSTQILGLARSLSLFSTRAIERTRRSPRRIDDLFGVMDSELP